MHRTLIGAALLAAALVCTGAIAMGTSESSSPARKTSTYDTAVKWVKAGDYRRALGLLKKVVADDAGNADAWNYLGYSYRELARFDEALDAYRKALALAPEHRGALEYLGELYLQMGDVGKAEEQLHKLEAVCASRCEEVDELKVAIARQKNG